MWIFGDFRDDFLDGEVRGIRGFRINYVFLLRGVDGFKSLLSNV